MREIGVRTLDPSHFLSVDDVVQLQPLAGTIGDGVCSRG
jgi:hypothetical protein